MRMRRSEKARRRDWNRIGIDRKEARVVRTLHGVFLLTIAFVVMNSSSDLRLPFAVRALTPSLGAEVLGVNLGAGMSDEVFRGIYAAFLRYQVLLFPQQDVPPERQVAFARRFGEVQVHVMNQYHADGFPELYRLSNLDEQGNPNGPASRQGHARVAHRRLVVARHRPGDDHLWRGNAGGRWRNAFLRHVRSIRASRSRVEGSHRGLRAVHNLDFSRTRRHGEDPMTEEQRRAKPPVDHPIVRTHAETGRKCIYLGDHAEYIVDMPYAEGRALIEELNKLAVHPDLSYEHHWHAGELLAWITAV
jgi:taurine dioxygenase